MQTQNENITLKMSSDLLKAARHKAVDAGMSVSAWVAQTLAGILNYEDEREKAKQRMLEYLKNPVLKIGKPLTRDEIYDR